MPPLRALRVFAVFGMILPFCLRAETWTLENGDRVTGKLLGEEGEIIHIQHPVLGLLKLPKSALKLEAPPTGTAADLAVVEEPKPKPKPEPAPAPVATPSPQMAESIAAAPVIKKPKFNWKRQIEFGFSQQSGTTSKEDLSIRGQVDAQYGNNTFRGTARLLQSEAQEQTVTDRREADFRWRYDITKRMFAQALTTYASDDVRAIDMSLEQQFGGGYRVVDVARHKVNIGLGAVVQYLEREGYEDATALLGSFFQDYSFAWNSRVKVTQESNLLVSDSSVFSSLGGRSGLSGVPRDGSYRMRFNTAVQSKVTAKMSLNVRYEYDYDRSVPDPDFRGDQRITTSLAYLW